MSALVWDAWLIRRYGLLAFLRDDFRVGRHRGAGRARRRWGRSAPAHRGPLYSVQTVLLLSGARPPAPV